MQMDPSMMLGRKVILDIAFLDEAHVDSSRTVAYLNGARPKRSLDCRRREAKIKLLPEAYALIYARAVFNQGADLMTLKAKD